MKRYALFACAAALLAACSSNSSSAPDSGPDAGPDGGPDAGPTWSAAVLVDADGGSGLDLASAVDPNGRPAVAYFTRNGIDDYSLVVARELSDGVWTQETLPANVDGGTSLTGHFGVSITFDNSGNPAVAYLGGHTSDSKGDGRWHSIEVDGGASLPSESVIALKSDGGWTQQIVATHSNSIVTTGFAVDDMGTVTGLWPALAFDSTGNVHLTIRDIHFGTDASAYQKSNLEYREAPGFNQAQSAGQLVSPSTEVPDAGPEGAGTYMKMKLWNDSPVVSYSLSDQATNDSKQVYFATHTAAGWSTQQLSALNANVGNGPSLAVAQGVGVAVGFLSFDNDGFGYLVVATSSDATNFLVGAVEAFGDTGYHPAVAYANGALGALYAYCRAPTDPSNQCNAAVNQIRFRVNGAAEWGELEPVAAVFPSSTALVGDGNGHFVAVYKDPAGGLKAQRRTP